MVDGEDEILMLELREVVENAPAEALLFEVADIITIAVKRVEQSVRDKKKYIYGKMSHISSRLCDLRPKLKMMEENDPLYRYTQSEIDRLQVDLYQLSRAYKHQHNMQLGTASQYIQPAVNGNPT